MHLEYFWDILFQLSRTNTLHVVFDFVQLFFDGKITLFVQYPFATTPGFQSLQVTIAPVAFVSLPLGKAWFFNMALVILGTGCGAPILGSRSLHWTIHPLEPARCPTSFTPPDQPIGT